MHDEKHKRNRGCQRNKLGVSRVVWADFMEKVAFGRKGKCPAGEVSCRKVGEGQPGGSSQHKHTKKETLGVL